MIVVADTGPIIALAKLDRIELLGVFGADILVPPRLRRELLSKPESETQEIEQAFDHLIQVREVPPLGATTKDAVDRLDPGEREAVGLAAALDEDTLLVMDDQVGRRVARQLNCSVTGVIGVLLRAKELGRIEAVTPLLEAMQSQGYWLSDDIIEHASELADEDDDAE
jgi:Predicted nucleic acid-binding protein, contains PIN domain